MFLARGFANFLKLQVDSSTELEANYDEAIMGSNSDDIADDTPFWDDSLSCEGGTERYAWWFYGVSDCAAVLDNVMPLLGTYLIDLDTDTIS